MRLQGFVHQSPVTLAECLNCAVDTFAAIVPEVATHIGVWLFRSKTTSSKPDEPVVSLPIATYPVSASSKTKHHDMALFLHEIMSKLALRNGYVTDVVMDAHQSNIVSARACHPNDFAFESHSVMF